MRCSNMKRQLKSALVERDMQTSKANELQSQLQDKKRQLFTAIQVRRAGRQEGQAAQGWQQRRKRQAGNPGRHFSCSTGCWLRDADGWQHVAQP